MEGGKSERSDSTEEADELPLAGASGGKRSAGLWNRRRETRRDIVLGHGVNGTSTDSEGELQGSEPIIRGAGCGNPARPDLQGGRGEQSPRSTRPGRHSVRRTSSAATAAPLRLRHAGPAVQLTPRTLGVPDYVTGDCTGERTAPPLHGRRVIRGHQPHIHDSFLQEAAPLHRSRRLTRLTSESGRARRRKSSRTSLVRCAVRCIVLECQHRRVS